MEQEQTNLEPKSASKKLRPRTEAQDVKITAEGNKTVEDAPGPGEEAAP